MLIAMTKQGEPVCKLCLEADWEALTLALPIWQRLGLRSDLAS